jgi:phosphohistidine phosphatase
MQVYLLRHGIAEEAKTGMSDAERSLTPDGRRKLRQVLSSAAEAGVQPDLILSSPLKRAIQTAELAQQVLKSKNEILQSNSLVPASNPDEVWEEIRRHKKASSILLAGHNPLFARLAPYLLGTPDVHVDFKKGAMMRLDFESLSIKPRGVLRWYLTARLAAT